MSTYYVAGLPYSSELYHHGLKGMRWGHRRFQNVDGSLTPAGRDRYGVGISEQSKNGSSQKTENKQSSKTRNNENNEKIEKRKRIAKTAAVAVGVGLAAYGAYKIHKISKDSKEYLRGLEAIRNNGSMSMSWTKAGHDSQAASKLLTNYANSSKLGKIKQVYGKHDLSWYTRFSNPLDTLSVDSDLRERLRQSRVGSWKR